MLYAMYAVSTLLMVGAFRYFGAACHRLSLTSQHEPPQLRQAISDIAFGLVLSTGSVYVALAAVFKAVSDTH